MREADKLKNGLQLGVQRETRETYYTRGLDDFPQLFGRLPLPLCFCLYWEQSRRKLHQHNGSGFRRSQDEQSPICSVLGKNTGRLLVPLLKSDGPKHSLEFERAPNF
ncbi:hypothetical protein MAR_ORF286 [Marseillevirus marseillevirus]|uniref:Uncharacterized protein n=1 Tax=Marseillevirus marseillevirus TaxID=694581 RepID=D2XAT3_GBMV|nr:hypothetical protein MAR_ORF286 [Marseillevirus marseillevirus]ADB04060.1 hypothetical protein MAR_ORF286 [Marseillevirus marseillevirus]